jgi:hypothetical protein
VIPATPGKSRAVAMFGCYERREMKQKFWTTFLIVMAVWFIGVVTSNTFSGYIHICAVFGVVSLGVYLFQGHR